MNKQKETPSLADINDAAMDCRANYENKQLMPRNIEEAFIKGALWYRNRKQINPDIKELIQWLEEQKKDAINNYIKHRDDEDVSNVLVGENMILGIVIDKLKKLTT